MFTHRLCNIQHVTNNYKHADDDGDDDKLYFYHCLFFLDMKNYEIRVANSQKASTKQNTDHSAANMLSLVNVFCIFFYISLKKNTEKAQNQNYCLTIHVSEEHSNTKNNIRIHPVYIQ